MVTDAGAEPTDGVVAVMVTVSGVVGLLGVATYTFCSNCRAPSRSEFQLNCSFGPMNV